MSMIKRKPTSHSFQRSKERFGLTKETTEKMIKNAYLYGISPDKLEDERLKKILVNRQKWKHKRLKIYNKKVFVFSMNSTRCITIYTLESVESEGKKK